MKTTLTVEVSKTREQTYDERKGLTVNRDVRLAELTYARVVGFGGHGRYRFAKVMTKQWELCNIKVPGGYWPRSGKEYVCLDLDLPVGTDEEYSPVAGMAVGFELVDLNGINEVWAPWGAIKIVRDVKSTVALGEGQDNTEMAPDALDQEAIDELAIKLLNEGTMPDDGIVRLEEQGRLSKRIRDYLDLLGISYDE